MSLASAAPTKVGSTGVTFEPPAGFKPVPKESFKVKRWTKPPQYVVGNEAASTTIAYGLYPNVTPAELWKVQQGMTMALNLADGLVWKNNAIIQHSGKKWLYMEMTVTNADSDDHSIVMVTDYDRQILVFNFMSTKEEFPRVEKALRASVASIRMPKTHQTEEGGRDVHDLKPWAGPEPEKELADIAKAKHELGKEIAQIRIDPLDFDPNSPESKRREKLGAEIYMLDVRARTVLGKLAGGDKNREFAIMRGIASKQVPELKASMEARIDSEMVSLSHWRLNEISSFLSAHAQDHDGNFPDTMDPVRTALEENSMDTKLLVDPWGNRYIYLGKGATFESPNGRPLIAENPKGRHKISVKYVGGKTKVIPVLEDGTVFQEPFGELNMQLNHALDKD